MSSSDYYIKGLTSDGDHLSGDIDKIFKEHYISLTFFSDEYITPITPSAGTAIVTATDDGFNYGTIENGTIDVSVAQYDRPFLWGRIKKVKVNLSGVTGATHFIATINSFN